MRSFVIACLVTLLPAAALATDLDRTLRVQGRLDTSGGQPASGDFQLTLGLYTQASGGSPVYVQGPETVTVTVGGLFEADLGPVPPNVIETASSLWLQTTVGSDVLPRQPLRSVPYALVAQRAMLADDLVCSGCVQAADVAFPYAAAASKGGEATGLNCSGCVESSELAPLAVATTHLQAQAVTPAKVSFTYAASASQGGPATGLTCTGCVVSGALAANLALAGNPTVSGTLSTCTSGAAGCGVVVGAASIRDQGDGALTIQAASGLRVRDAANTAYRQVTAGDVTALGDLSVIGTAAVQGALTAAALGAGTTSPGAMLDVVGDARLAGSNRYLSFGSTVGGGGYGFRDQGGTMQFRDTGGTWAPFSNGLVPLGTTRPTSPVAGTLFFNTTSKILEIYTGTEWLGVSPKATRRSCLEIRDTGESEGSGIYKIQPVGATSPYDVYCDMSADGGGWTLVARAKGSGTEFAPYSSNWASTSSFGTQATIGDNNAMKSPAWSQVTGDILRLCYRGPGSNCARFTHNRGDTLSVIFSSSSRTDVTDGWSWSSLASAFAVPNAGSPGAHYCGLNLAFATNGGCNVVSANSISDGGTGDILRVGCIGDNTGSGFAGCAGGPDDYALGVGVSSCYDGGSCGNVGNGGNTTPSHHIRGGAYQSDRAYIDSTSFFWVR